MGLGQYATVGLAEAREGVLAGRKTLAGGTDPMAERKAEAEAKQRSIEAQQRENEMSFENIA